MALPGISAPAEGRAMISDDYLDDNAGSTGAKADIDSLNLTPAEAFVNTQFPKTGASGLTEPRGLSINAALDSSENPDLTATSGNVNGRYKNDPAGNEMVERFACGITHPCRFRMIRPRNTTARGIIIKF